MRRRVVLALVGLTALAIAVVILTWGYEACCADRIYPGVRVWGVHLGGLRRDEAIARLAEALDRELAQPTVILQGPDRSWPVRPADLGLQLEAAATAEEAYQVGRGPDAGWLAHLDILLAGRDVAPILSFSEPAARLYLEALAREIDRSPVDASFTLDGTTPAASPSQPGRALDIDASLAAVRVAAVTGQATLVAVEVPPQMVDAEAARARVEELLSQPLALVLPDPREGDPGPWSISPVELAAMLVVRPSGDRLEATLDETLLRGYLGTLTATLAIEPVNARFHFDETSGQLEPISASSAGRALDVEASLQNVLSAVAAGYHAAPLVLQTVPPLYAETSTAEELGIRELVAVGDSYFIGSPSGRDHNIRLGAGRFDGIVIPPGESFSFNFYLGEVSAETGYDEAYITAGEQLAVEVGGGICQVSTTAFRAALWGGYRITERWFHYQRVGYYELRGYGPGFDATVYSPLLDFRFVNDRATALLIETEVIEADHRLVFRFYSTDDGRQTEVEGPEVGQETEPGPPIYQLDPDLAPGTVIEWQTAQNGLTATVERWVYDAAGALLYHDTYDSRYAPRRAAYHYGPGYEPPDSP